MLYRFLWGLAARIGGGNKLTTSLGVSRRALLGILAGRGYTGVRTDEVITSDS